MLLTYCPARIRYIVEDPQGKGIPGQTIKRGETSKIPWRLQPRGGRRAKQSNAYSKTRRDHCFCTSTAVELVCPVASWWSLVLRLFGCVLRLAVAPVVSHPFLHDSGHIAPSTFLGTKTCKLSMGNPFVSTRLVDHIIMLAVNQFNLLHFKVASRISY